MKIKMIAAVDPNWCIGKDNELLFHDSDDLAYFKEVTKNSIVIMGRKTWESLPNKPLPDRFNFIITNNKNLINSNKYENNMSSNYFYGTLDDLKTFLLRYIYFIQYIKYKNIFIIGGESIYKSFEPYIDVAYINMFHEPKSGNKYIMNYDNSLDFKKHVIPNNYDNFDTFVYIRKKEIKNEN